MASTTSNVQNLSSTKNVSKIPISQTSTRKNRNIQRSNDDLTKQLKLKPKKIFGSTGSLNTKTSSQEHLSSKKLLYDKNTLSDSNLNKGYITKRNVIKAQLSKDSVENIIKPEPIKISFSKESIVNVQIQEPTKEESTNGLEELLTLISRIEDEEKLESPNKEIINELKSQCYKIIFKNSTTEKWMIYFHKVLEEFKIEENKVEKRKTKLVKDFEDNTRKINELEAKILTMEKYEKTLTNFKKHILKEKNFYKMEIDNYETTCKEIYTQFNNSLENCVYNKCNEINENINRIFDKFTKKSLENYKNMETLINKYKPQ